MGVLSQSNGLNPILTVNITEEVRNKFLEFPKAKRWLEKKKAKSAMSYYAAGRNLAILQRATGQDPDSFLKWSKQQEEATDIQDKLDDIAKQLPKSEGYNFKNYLRGFLKSYGTQLPTADNSYINQEEHPEYKKDEILQLLSYLQDKRHKLYVHIIAESGLRHHHVVQLRIRHLQEDLMANKIPVAIRLDPEHYSGKKLAGHAFLGTESIKLLKECQEERKIGKNPEDRVIPLQYSTLNEALRRAKKNAKLDKRIQPSHGLRKYFEHALDKAGIDHELKMRIEGHNNGTRGKAYTTRDWDELRKEYAKAYPLINIHDPTGTQAWTELQEKVEASGETSKELLQLRNELTSVKKLLAANQLWMIEDDKIHLTNDERTRIQYWRQHPEKIQTEDALNLLRKSHPNNDIFESRKFYETAYGRIIAKEGLTQIEVEKIAKKRREEFESQTKDEDKILDEKLGTFLKTLTPEQYKLIKRFVEIVEPEAAS